MSDPLRPLCRIRVKTVLLIALATTMTIAWPAFAGAATDPAATTPPGLAKYRSHLTQLQDVVAACQQQRTPMSCDPSLVGADDRVQWPSGSTSLREIRYDWLRALLDRAGKKEEQAPKEKDAQQPPAPTVDSLLTAAHQRLADDAKQTDLLPSSSAIYAAEHQSLSSILARREFQGATTTSARERALNWLANWIDRIFGNLYAYGSRSPWIGLLIRGLLLVSVCVGFIWALIRIERRSRTRLLDEAPSISGAPSAREWQLWLRDAHSMANSELWREAIHYLYWAVIARLESRRLWPADRARTPREYLRLLPVADPRRKDLTALTRSFEHTWYGGRPAGSAEYRAALSLAAELGVE